MIAGAGREELCDAVTLPVGEVNREVAVLHKGRTILQTRRLGDHGQFRNELRSPPEVAGVRYTREAGIGARQILFCDVEKRGRTVDVARALRGPPDLYALQDLALKAPTESLNRLQTVLLGRSFQLFNRIDAELLVQLQHFFCPQTGNGEHLKHSLGDLLSEL